MNAKQFAWVYLIKQCMPNMEPSYYGGYDVIDESIEPKIDKSSLPTKYHDAVIEKLKLREKHFSDMIKRIGVDWDRTQYPKSDKYSSFQGTFACDNTREGLFGCLVLKDSTKIQYFGEALVVDVFEAMANIDEYKQSFIDIFGETA